MIDIPSELDGLRALVAHSLTELVPTSSRAVVKLSMARMEIPTLQVAKVLSAMGIPMSSITTTVRSPSRNFLHLKSY
jgi:hypothetical protein